MLFLAWTVLGLFFLAGVGYFKGRASLEEIRAQARADAVALGAAEAIRAYGVDYMCDAEYGGKYLEALYTFNDGVGRFDCPAEESKVDGIWMTYAVDQTQKRPVNASFSQWAVDFEVVQQSRAMRIYEKELEYDDFLPIYPNVDVILDYSDSMDDPMQGGRKRIRELQDAMKTFLNEAKNVNVGLTLFASDVLRAQAIEELTPAHKNTIESRVNTTTLRLDEQLGRTNYIEALNRSFAKLLTRQEGRRIMLFITDGTPTVPEPRELAPERAIAEAQRIRNSGQMDEIYGLYVGDDVSRDGGRSGVEVLGDIVSQPDPDDPGLNPFLEVGRNADAYENFLKTFSFFYICRMLEPVEDALAENFPASGTVAWIKPKGVDEPGTPMEFVPFDASVEYDILNTVKDGDELVGVEDKYRYSVFVPAADPERRLHLTINHAACEALKLGTHEIVFRSGFSMLASNETEL
ncbi:MAG: vWA domain-containing protein [Myxococcota bacterium]|nr:vWA domain-containing protein [Myxococcota bacterium]